MHKRQVKRLQLIISEETVPGHIKGPSTAIFDPFTPKPHLLLLLLFFCFLPAQNVCYQILCRKCLPTFGPNDSINIFKEKKCNNQKGQWLVKGGKHKKTKARCTHMSVKQGSQLDEGPGLANPCCKNGRIAFPQCISSCESIVYRAYLYARHYTQHFTCIV